MPIPHALIGEEEERTVFDDRAAERPAEVIQPRLRPRDWSRVIVLIEVVVRFKFVIAEIVIRHAMELIGTGARRQLNLSTRLPAELCRIVRGLHFELLESVDRDHAVRSTEGVEGRD